MSHTDPPSLRGREKFATRSAFILAAVGSAVGLGNIWRFPYVAYEGGGGAFLIPYLVALLSAGIPLLFFDYAIGHKFRGSPPMAFRRLSKHTEGIGWFQVAICFMIAVYYAAIVAWAVMYSYFSVTKAWGDDPKGFLFTKFLQMPDQAGVSLQPVAQVMIPLIVVWLVVIAILALGVQRGIGAANKIFMPLLVVMFIALVVVAVTLPGAASGLNAMFTPDWSKLGDWHIWISAYGQIFFSLSVGFGIMITYSSYLKRKTDLTGSGLVVGLANSAFEILAAIGVFAALGFMASASGQPIDKVAGAGIGLAFVAFPAIISEAPFGSVIGLLFFVSLVFAGLTSLISICEVVISSVKDKLGWSRRVATIVVGGVMAIVSLTLFPMTTGLYALDTIDAFTNNIGIVTAALAAMVVVAFAVRRLGVLQDHLNERSTFKVGLVWQILISVVTPIVLVVLLVIYTYTRVTSGYEGYPAWYVGTFGWGVVAGMVIVAVLLPLIPWPKKSALHTEEVDHDQVDATEGTNA